MKKICCAVLVALGLMLPNSAKAETMGLYMAPKFVLNMQHMDVATPTQVGNTDVAGEKDGSSAGAAIAIGYDFSKKFNIPVRAELEFGAYGNVSKDDSAFDGFFIEEDIEAKVTVRTLLANVYWDITTWNDFTPYVGAGIGVAFVKTKVNNGMDVFGTNIGSTSDSQTDTVLAGQIGLGCSYAFNENVSVDLGYRFLMMDDGDEMDWGPMGGTLEATDNYAHQLMLGLRLTF